MMYVTSKNSIYSHADEVLFSILPSNYISNSVEQYAQTGTWHVSPLQVK